MSTFKQISLNTSYQLVAKAVTTVATLLTTIFITKSFGVSGYGEFTIAMAYSALFYLAVDFGLNAVVTKELTGDDKSIPRYFRNLVGLRLVLSSSLFLVGIIPLIFLPYSDSLKLSVTISALTIITQAMFTAGSMVYQLKLRYDISAIADIVSALSVLTLTYIFSVNNSGIPLIVSAYVLGGILRVAFGYYLIRGYTGGFGISFDTRLWRTLLLLSLPIGLAGVFGQINSNADKIIISIVDHPFEVTGEEAAGFYGLAYKIFEVILVVPAFFINAAYPVMLQHAKESHAKLLSTVQKIYGAMLVLSLIASLVGYVLAPLVISFFKADEGDFGLSVEILRILLLGLPIFYLSAVSLWTLISVGRAKTLILTYGVAAILNVLLNLVYIPVYGVLASAVITILTEIFIIGVNTYIGLSTLLRLVKQK